MLSETLSRRSELSGPVRGGVEVQGSAQLVHLLLLLFARLSPSSVRMCHRCRRRCRRRRLLLSTSAAGAGAGGGRQRRKSNCRDGRLLGQDLSKQTGGPATARHPLPSLERYAWRLRGSCYCCCCRRSCGREVDDGAGDVAEVLHVRGGDMRRYQ